MTSNPSRQLEEARQLDGAGRCEEAVAVFRSFLSLNPEHAEAWAELAGLLLVLGRLDEAEDACGHALHIEPLLYGALVHLASVKMLQGDLDAAEELFGNAIKQEPERIAGRLMFSDCLVRRGDLEGARELLEKIIEQVPGHAIALDRLNIVLTCQGDWIGLRKDMERQLVRFTGAEAEYVASHLDLMFGDMPKGWERFESRLRIPERLASGRAFDSPKWQGEPFPGKTLLLSWEQGFGDTVMFLRFAPMAKALGGRVLLEVQPPLAELAATCAGIDMVIPAGQPLPPFDLHASILSLPALFSTRLESIPADVPYLGVPPNVPDREAIDRVLAPSEGRIRVGVCWAGSTAYPRDAKRSMPPAFLAPLGELPHVAWHSFQFEPRDPAPLPGITTFGPLLKGFPNTVYALQKMDLLVTVDTVLAHLGGALGIPTFLLLSFLPDWRWMLGREDSPWYPTLRLYRQPAPGDWESVIDQVIWDLAEPEEPV